MSTVTDMDFARLAAYIDGEGCISITRAKADHTRREKTALHHLRINIYNCDPRLMEWCKKTFSCGSILKHQKTKHPTHRLSYLWMVQDAKAERLIRDCLPYFIIKREQAEVALAFRATMIRSGRHPKSRTPQYIINAREGYKRQLSELKYIEVPRELIA